MFGQRRHQHQGDIPHVPHAGPHLSEGRGGQFRLEETVERLRVGDEGTATGRQLRRREDQAVRIGGRGGERGGEAAIPLPDPQGEQEDQAADAQRERHR